MESEAEDEAEDCGEPVTKREKVEVIQVLQVGALDGGGGAVVGMVQPGVLSSLPPTASGHTEHILTPTIRHCSSTGSTYTSV